MPAALRALVAAAFFAAALRFRVIAALAAAARRFRVAAALSPAARFFSVDAAFFPVDAAMIAPFVRLDSTAQQMKRLRTATMSPSRYTAVMRVFVDSRDLINIFNDEQPISISEFAAILTGGGHQLVIPFSLVSELIPADNNHFTVLWRFMKIEEDIPHVFLQQKELTFVELRNAADDFVHERPLAAYDPYVTSFTELWGREAFAKDPISLMELERRIDLRKMSQQIELTLERAEIYHWSKAEEARAVRILTDEKKAISADRSKRAFRNSLVRSLRHSRIELEEGQANSFAEMLYRTPSVAPGWRLYSEVFEQLARNTNYNPTVSDTWDFAHIAMLPYVDAATLDNNKAEMVKQVTRRLRGFDASLNYDERVTPRISDLLAKLRG